jgi:hypothetical protein
MSASSFESLVVVPARQDERRAQLFALLWTAAYLLQPAHVVTVDLGQLPVSFG